MFTCGFKIVLISNPTLITPPLYKVSHHNENICRRMQEFVSKSKPGGQEQSIIILSPFFPLVNIHVFTRLLTHAVQELTRLECSRMEQHRVRNSKYASIHPLLRPSTLDTGSICAKKKKINSCFPNTQLSDKEATSAPGDVCSF